MWPLDAQPFHSRSQGARIYSQELSGSIAAFYSPSDFPERYQDVLPFSFDKSFGHFLLYLVKGDIIYLLIEPELGTIAHDNRPLDYIDQLPNIARPGVIFEGFHAVLGDLFCAFAMILAKFFYIKFHDERNILFPLPERRDGD